ncbi:MAG: type II toxin-antitoxin system Phd/YefM family antitoxin [Bacteriovoracaceae bacterium]|nr:type II toxin-antitoxin system Phd/YefM family antitoxin [Bacteriovoracaceae bacterium]
MESTSPKKLRAELKDYLDLAAREPIRIQRRSGENYIIMNENVYAQMQNEISSLQRRLLGMSEIIDGKTTEYKGKQDRLKRFKK